MIGIKKTLMLGFMVICLTGFLHPDDSLTPENIERCKKQFVANSETIAFTAGKFSLKGILVKPDNAGPHPVIVFNHGDSAGLINRTSNGVYWIIWEKLLKIGYACLSWDTPGSGESTGKHNWDDLFNERTAIVLAAIEYLKSRDDIDRSRIGLFGHSQAGYIMPMVISKSKDVAFMINMSGPAMTSRKQGAFQLKQQLIAHGMSDLEAQKYAEYHLKKGTAKTYKNYLEYARLLHRNDYIRNELKKGEIVPEDQFKPAVPGFQWNYAPYDLLKKMTIPVLAIFGARDNLINAKEDAVLYRKALKAADNRHYAIKVFQDGDHSLGHRKNGIYMFVPGVFEYMCDWLSKLER